MRKKSLLRMIASGIMPTTDHARAPLRASRKQNAATNCTMAESSAGMEPLRQSEITRTSSSRRFVMSPLCFSPRLPW